MKLSTIIFITVCCYAQQINSTSETLSEEEIGILLERINQLRVNQGAEDMAKVCWSEELATEVLDKANGCDAVMTKDATGFFFRSITTGEDTVRGGVDSMASNVDRSSPQMTTCTHAESCSLYKILVTNKLTEINCAKARCGDPEIHYLYCGVTESMAFEVGDESFTLGTPCEGCAEGEDCEQGLCLRDACQLPTTTTTEAMTTDNGRNMNETVLGTMKPKNSAEDDDRMTQFLMRMYYSGANDKKIFGALAITVSIVLVSIFTP